AQGPVHGKRRMFTHSVCAAREHICQWESRMTEITARSIFRIERRLVRRAKGIGPFLVRQLRANVYGWNPLFCTDPIAEWQHMVFTVEMMAFRLGSLNLPANVILKIPRANCLRYFVNSSSFAAFQPHPISPVVISERSLRPAVRNQVITGEITF